MAIITISRELGSLGTEIAQALADQLHYDYIDKEKIASSLAGFGLQAPEVERFDEKKPPFWDSVQIHRRRFVHLLQAVIFDYARRGNAVLVGRGGQVLLKSLPGALHVRIFAPFETRVNRLKTQEGGDEKEAVRIVRRSDRDSAGFIRSFFDIAWDDPSYYDFLLNTQKIAVNTGVRMIMGALQAPEIHESGRRTEEKLGDLALFQKVEAALMDILGIEIRRVNLQVAGGSVTLRGAVSSTAERERCEKAVAAIAGIRKIDNQLLATDNLRFGG